MKRIIKLTESDLIKIIKKVINENSGEDKPDDFDEYIGRTDIYADSIGTEKKDDDLTSQEVV